ncbi:MAG: glycosyltransferase family 4 protein [Flavobacteriales bacterium]|nr:glycosyltransferase family 4 protein [Flavobacteriales bacterium]
MSTTVCMFVYNNCTTDARVLKEAASLVKGGYQVRIIAVMDNGVQPYEVRDGIEIFRVIKNPLHYRIFNGDLFFDLFKPKQKDIIKKLRANYLKQSDQSGASKTASNKKKSLRKQPLPELLASFKSDLKSNPGQLILYKWLFYFFIFLSRLFRLIFLMPLKSIFMVVHKPLCFYDFYKRSLILNKEEPSDIYHGHDLHTVPTAYRTAKLTNSKVVYDAHELYTEMSGLKPVERKFYTRFERKYAPKVDALITVNESIANELVERYKLNRKPDIIYNCPEVNDNIVTTKNDELRERLNLSPETKIVLYQGGFTINRGLYKLIQAAQYINDNAKVVYMGWGKIEDDLKAEVAKYNLQDKVLFTPGVPQKELLNNSKSAQVGVIPYQFVGLNNYYTSPNKLFEYINANVPIAGSDFPELKRVINKYTIGETFDPEDPKSIAAAINKILDNENYYLQLKENTKFAAKDFTWDKEEEKLLAIYDRITNG